MLLAVKTFEDCKASIEALFHDNISDTIQFSKLNAFNGSVLYLEPEIGCSLLKLRELTALLRGNFCEAGLISEPPSDSWTPHLTIAKRSKNFKRRLKSKEIFSANAYKQLGCIDTPLSCELSVVELLEMSGASSAESDYMNVEGYYKSLSSLPLVNSIYKERKKETHCEKKEC